MPILPLTKKIIEADGKPSDYVFITTATTPFGGFRNGEKAPDKHCGEPALPEWHLHDLRRTCATELAKLGVKQEATEAILNHKIGKVIVVAAIYNRYASQEEKRVALEQWANSMQVVTADNVTILKIFV